MGGNWNDYKKHTFSVQENYAHKFSIVKIQMIFYINFSYLCPGASFIKLCVGCTWEGGLRRTKQINTHKNILISKTLRMHVLRRFPFINYNQLEMWRSICGLHVTPIFAYKQSKKHPVLIFIQTSDVQSVEAGEAEPHLSYSNVTEKQLKKN